MAALSRLRLLILALVVFGLAVGRPDRVVLVANLTLVVNDPESIVADLITTEVAMNQAVPS